MNYREALEFILSFPDWERGVSSPRGQMMSLVCMKSLLARCGNPQNGRRTIHITGSKGKGSVSVMIASILQAANKRTALFTSPHLHSYLEQIAIDLTPITEAEFTQALEFLKPHIEAEHASSLGPVSTFSILTLLFFYIARQKSIEYQIVEVGMGGRDDATNVLDQKDIAVITSISLEHTSILGKTSAEIADIKCGIITPGCTVVLAPQPDPAVKSVVMHHVTQKGAKLIDVEMPGTQQFATRLLGSHQLTNSATAVAVAHVLRNLGEDITDEHIAAGLANAYLPARFEILQENPTIIIDGAHNSASAQALAETMQEYCPNQKAIIVLGVNQDKDLTGILSVLKPITEMIIATKSNSARALEPELIAEHAKKMGLRAIVTADVTSAAQSAIAYSRKQEENIILATGSFRIAAEISAIVSVKKTIDI